MAKAAPNLGHRALAGLERRIFFILVTQNVDGLHARAGSQKVMELHGNILRSKGSLDHERSKEVPSSATNLPRAA